MLLPGSLVRGFWVARLGDIFLVEQFQQRTGAQESPIRAVLGQEYSLGTDIGGKNLEYFLDTGVYFRDRDF